MAKVGRAPEILYLESLSLEHISNLSKLLLFFHNAAY